MAGTLTVQNIEGPSSGANANKVIIPSGQTLYAPGHVVQVVRANFTTNNVTSSSSYVATDIEASITPTSASSLILVNVCTGIDTNNTTRAAYLTLYRDNTTNLKQGSSDWIVFGVSNSGRIQIPGNLQYMDSPATTSSVTYTLYHRSGGSYQTEVPGTFQTQQITLMEIAQ